MRSSQAEYKLRRAEHPPAQKKTQKDHRQQCKTCGQVKPLWTFRLRHQEGEREYATSCNTCRDKIRRSVAFHPDDETRICRHCGVAKPHEDFYGDSGVSCKTCELLDRKLRRAGALTDELRDLWSRCAPGHLDAFRAACLAVDQSRDEQAARCRAESAQRADERHEAQEQHQHQKAQERREREDEESRRKAAFEASRKSLGLWYPLAKDEKERRWNNQTQSRANRKRRQSLLDGYGHRCTCCGETHRHFLALDHVNGGGKQSGHHAQSQKLYKSLLHQGCPTDDYQLLCHNCNHAKGIFGTCPHIIPPPPPTPAKLAVIAAYGGGCDCCGETNPAFLCLDHVAGGGEEERRANNGRAGNQFYRWVQNRGFPDHYRMLCYNCNMALGVYGYCPHHTLESRSLGCRLHRPASGQLCLVFGQLTNQPIFGIVQ